MIIMRCAICGTNLGVYEGEYTARQVMKKKPNKCPTCNFRTPSGHIKFKKGERYYRQNIEKMWGR